MTDLQLTIDERPTWGDTLVRWVPRILLALVFLSLGRDKFAASSLWVRIFAAIGLGQWFRYLTGVMQVGGAVLLLVPRTAVVGAAILACTMAGAVFTQIVVFHSITAIIPAILLGVIVAVGLGAISDFGRGTR